MNKSVYLLLALFCALQTYDSVAQPTAREQAGVLKDEACRDYMNHKTDTFRYKHPKTNRYYASLWWHPPVANVHPQRFFSPIKYYRNGWPYYWFY